MTLGWCSFHACLRRSQWSDTPVPTAGISQRLSFHIPPLPSFLLPEITSQTTCLPTHISSSAFRKTQIKRTNTTQPSSERNFSNPWVPLFSKYLRAKQLMYCNHKIKQDKVPVIKELHLIRENSHKHTWNKCDMSQRLCKREPCCEVGVPTSACGGAPRTPSVPTSDSVGSI